MTPSPTERAEIAAALAEAELDADLIEAAGDSSYDDAVRASHQKRVEAPEESPARETQLAH